LTGRTVWISHRPLSTYLNELIGLGCRVREIEERTEAKACATSGVDRF
jgi:hypothetical protein